MGGNFRMNREGYLKIAQDTSNLWCWHYFLADTSQKEVIAGASPGYVRFGGDLYSYCNNNDKQQNSFCRAKGFGNL